MVDGRWEMGDGRWEMGDGRWKMEDGRWEMGDGSDLYVTRRVCSINCVKDKKWMFKFFKFDNYERTI